MDRLMKWMSEKFAPKAGKFSHNPWVAAIQESMVDIMPIILVSSFVSIIAILQSYIPSLPDFSYISSYTFGICGIFVSYLIPVLLFEKKRIRKYARQAGLMGVALFVMMIGPTIDETGMFIVDSSRLGSGAIFTAMIAGAIDALVFEKCTRFSLFKNSNAMPKYLADSFDSMLPVVIVSLIGYVLCYLFKLDMFNLISIALSPLGNIAESYWGFVLTMFLMGFFYSFGISPWLLTPVYTPIALAAIAKNAADYAAGVTPSLTYTTEAFQAWVWLGGTGCTLMLCIFFLRAKSEKLRTIGKAAIVPSILEINEPVVFGAIVMNPILMIPMWICSFLVPTIAYAALKTGIVTIPFRMFQLWYMPLGFSAYLCNQDVRGVILVILLLALTAAIYYPFFKVYDNQLVKEEAAKQEA